jgi:hypothetical protein
VNTGAFGLTALHRTIRAGVLRLRRFRGGLLSPLFPLLLLLAQQGALLHELSHYAAGESRPQNGEQHSHDAYCERCLAFAQVGAGAPPQAPVADPPGQLAFRPALPVQPQVGATPLATARNRGPPAAL